jgi:AcrR family transcriptional regulator
VQDVLDRAAVARSSFYAHFRDKEDLLLAGYADVAAAEDENLFVTETAGAATLGLPLFQHVWRYKEVAVVLLGAPSGKPIVEHMRNLLIVQAREWWQRSVASRRVDVPTELAVQYLVSALIGMLTWWVVHDFPYSADDMGAAYTRLARAGLDGFTRAG